MTIAAAAPCSRRATTRLPPFQAMPQRAEATINSATPPMNVRLRPRVSPNRPPSRIRPPKVSMYAVITQLSPASERPRSFWILGSAKIDTVPSMVATSWTPPIAPTGPRNPRERHNGTGGVIAPCAVVIGSAGMLAIRFAGVPAHRSVLRP